MTEKTFATVGLALEAILQNQDSKALNYCVNYTRHALALYDEGRLGELKSQLLYVVTNMSHWRGETAVKVRNTLRQAVEEL